MLLVGLKLTEAIGLRKVFDCDVLRRGLALGFERIELALAGLNALECLALLLLVAAGRVWIRSCAGAGSSVRERRET